MIFQATSHLICILREAEATPELRDQLLSYNPVIVIKYYDHIHATKYLGYIRRLVRFLEAHFSIILTII